MCQNADLFSQECKTTQDGATAIDVTLENTITHQEIEFDQTKELVKVVSDFSYGLSILDDYDHQSIGKTK